MILGASEVTANLYCNFVYLYWEGCVICSIYLRKQFLMNFEGTTVVYLNKGLKQIKLPISLHTCAPISNLPFNEGSMMFTKSKLGHQRTIKRIKVLLWNFLVLIVSWYIY